MLIQKMDLYIDRHSVGPFHVYLALETADDPTDIIKVVDLTKDTFTYLTGESVLEYDGVLDDELLKVYQKYI